MDLDLFIGYSVFLLAIALIIFVWKYFQFLIRRSEKRKQLENQCWLDEWRAGPGKGLRYKKEPKCK